MNRVKNAKLVLWLITGFAAAVANARDEVKAVCDYVTIAEGGNGAIREIIEMILKRQEKFFNLIEELSQ